MLFTVHIEVSSKKQRSEFVHCLVLSWLSVFGFCFCILFFTFNLQILHLVERTKEKDMEREKGSERERERENVKKIMEAKKNAPKNSEIRRI